MSLESDTRYFLSFLHTKKRNFMLTLYNFNRVVMYWHEYCHGSSYTLQLTAESSISKLWNYLLDTHKRLYISAIQKFGKEGKTFIVQYSRRKQVAQSDLIIQHKYQYWHAFTLVSAPALIVCNLCRWGKKTSVWIDGI